MGISPEVRLKFARAFSYTGVDLTGPFDCGSSIPEDEQDLFSPLCMLNDKSCPFEDCIRFNGAGIPYVSLAVYKSSRSSHRNV